MLVTLMALEAGYPPICLGISSKTLAHLPVQMSSNHLAILEYGQFY